MKVWWLHFLATSAFLNLGANSKIQERVLLMGLSKKTKTQEFLSSCRKFLDFLKCHNSLYSLKKDQSKHLGQRLEEKLSAITPVPFLPLPFFCFGRALWVLSLILVSTAQLDHRSLQSILQSVISHLLCNTPSKSYQGITGNRDLCSVPFLWLYPILCFWASLCYFLTVNQVPGFKLTITSLAS